MLDTTVGGLPTLLRTGGVLLNGLGALARIGFLGAYTGSVNAGKAWVTSTVNTFANTCPASKIILSGYSQGAQIAADLFQTPSVHRKVFAVVLWGDPKFNPQDPSAQGSFSRKRYGIFGKRGGFGGRVISFCHGGDPVCQGIGIPLQPSHHTDYGSVKESVQAAGFLVGLG